MQCYSIFVVIMFIEAFAWRFATITISVQQVVRRRRESE